MYYVVYSQYSCNFIFEITVSDDFCFFSTALPYNISVTITSNITDGIICYSNQSVELSCHANSINVIQYKWTSTKFKHPEETANITIVATDDPVKYTCTVSDANNDTGYSSINISTNGKLEASKLYTSWICINNKVKIVIRTS